MLKLNKCFSLVILMGSLLFFVACEKDFADTITSNDAVQARLSYTEKGYSEIEVSPIVKLNCYFQDWDKEVMIPVSGLFEYYDSDGNWVASIDFGDGSCDEWVTKTWNIDFFPDDPSGTIDFSVFDYKEKK